MKNEKIIKDYLFYICVVLFGILCFVSCRSSNEDENIETESLTKKHIEIDGITLTQEKIEAVISEIKSLGDSQGKIIVFRVENILKKDYQKYFQVIKDSKKVLIFSAGSNNYSKTGSGDNYTVTCNLPDGQTTVTECGEDVGCAGHATWECLEHGGCATICNAKITYIPSKIKDGEITKQEAIESVLEQAKEISETKNKAISFKIAFYDNKFWLKEISEIKIENSNEDYLTKTDPGSYTVDCHNSDGDIIWSESFNNKLDASIAILDYTDNYGGCAEICETVGRYVPFGKGKK